MPMTPGVQPFGIRHSAFSVSGIRHSPFAIDNGASPRAFSAVIRAVAPRRPARVVVALSGGGDSVALLGLLRELHARGDVVLAGAAHLNHQLRGAAADADEAFCRDLAGRLGVPFVSERADVAAAAREQRRSLEDAARAARYAFLERARGRARRRRRRDGAHPRRPGRDVPPAHPPRRRHARAVRHPRTRGSRRPPAARLSAAQTSGPISRRAARRAARTRPTPDAQHSAKPRTARADSVPRGAVTTPPSCRCWRGKRPSLARGRRFSARTGNRHWPDAIGLIGRRRRNCAIDARATRRRPTPALSSRVALDALSPVRRIAVDWIPACRPAAVAGRRAAVRGGAQPAGSDAPSGYSDEVRASARSPTRRQRTLSRFRCLFLERSVSAAWAVSASRPAGPLGASNRPGRAAATRSGVASAALELPLAVRSRRPGDRFRPLGRLAAASCRIFS